LRFVNILVVIVISKHVNCLGKCRSGYENHSCPVMDQAARNENRAIIFSSMQLFDIDVALLKEIISFLAT
jgi:hypothetical protein